MRGWGLVLGSCKMGLPKISRQIGTAKRRKCKKCRPLFKLTKYQQHSLPFPLPSTFPSLPSKRRQKKAWKEESNPQNLNLHLNLSRLILLEPSFVSIIILDMEDSSTAASNVARAISAALDWSSSPESRKAAVSYLESVRFPHFYPFHFCFSHFVLLNI